MPDLGKIIDSFGKKLVTDLRQSLRDNGVTFQGGADSRLAATAKYEIELTDGGFEFRLYMRPEWYWVNNGREPGSVSKEGSDSIEEWVLRKGILGSFIKSNLEQRISAQDKRKQLATTKRTYKELKKLPVETAKKSLAYIVKRKVTIKGYEATHFYDEVINDGRLKELQDIILQDTKKQIIIELK